jgi:hypothetical protein
LTATESDRLSRDDRLTLCLLGFFVVIAGSVELYYLLDLHSIAHNTDPLAEGLRFYGRSDRVYAGHGDTSLAVALEGINVFVTQPLNVILAWAIIRRKAYRHPLQLTVSAYVTYSVVLYLTVQSVSGYRYMQHKSVLAYLVLYVANLPWLAGYGYLAHHSFTALLAPWRRSRTGQRA